MSLVWFPLTWYSNYRSPAWEFLRSTGYCAPPSQCSERNFSLELESVIVVEAGLVFLSSLTLVETHGKAHLHLNVTPPAIRSPSSLLHPSHQHESPGSPPSFSNHCLPINTKSLQLHNLCECFLNEPHIATQQEPSNGKHCQHAYNRLGNMSYGWDRWAPLWLKSY